jgi:hypothetical protein
VAEPATRLNQELTGDDNQPLIGIPMTGGSGEVVRYFTSDEDADRAISLDKGNIQRALSAIGAWAHLDDEDGPDMLDELDRMRHASKPTPPFEL